MVPTLVPVAGGMAEAEEGAFGTAAPEDAVVAGEAAVPAGVVCAHAVSDRLNTAATRILTNLLVIGSFGLLRISSGIRWALQTDLNRADRTSAANALRAAGARLFTPNLKRGDHPDFVGVDGTDYRRPREQRQTVASALCRQGAGATRSVSEPVFQLHADFSRIGEMRSAESVAVVEQIVVIAEVESGDPHVPVLPELLAQG